MKFSVIYLLAGFAIATSAPVGTELEAVQTAMMDALDVQSAAYKRKEQCGRAFGASHNDPQALADFREAEAAYGAALGVFVEACKAYKAVAEK